VVRSGQDPIVVNLDIESPEPGTPSNERPVSSSLMSSDAPYRIDDINMIRRTDGRVWPSRSAASKRKRSRAVISAARYRPAVWRRLRKR